METNIRQHLRVSVATNIMDKQGNIKPMYCFNGACFLQITKMMYLYYEILTIMADHYLTIRGCSLTSFATGSCVEI